VLVMFSLLFVSFLLLAGYMNKVVGGFSWNLGNGLVMGSTEKLLKFWNLSWTLQKYTINYHNQHFYLWHFGLYQRPSSEEVWSILLPVLATVVMGCGKKSVVRVEHVSWDYLEHILDILSFSLAMWYWCTKCSAVLENLADVPSALQ